jgi:hypothetical protein
VGGEKSVGAVGCRFEEKQLKIHGPHQNLSQKTTHFTGDLYQGDGVPTRGQNSTFHEDHRLNWKLHITIPHPVTNQKVHCGLKEIRQANMFKQFSKRNV